jgi:hypothetical protein
MSFNFPAVAGYLVVVQVIIVVPFLVITILPAVKIRRHHFLQLTRRRTHHDGNIEVVDKERTSQNAN